MVRVIGALRTCRAAATRHLSHSRHGQLCVGACGPQVEDCRAAAGSDGLTPRSSCYYRKGNQKPRRTGIACGSCLSRRSTKYTESAVGGGYSRLALNAACCHIARLPIKTPRQRLAAHSADLECANQGRCFAG